MALYKYSIDGSSLTINERQKLIQLLDDFAYTGTIYMDMEYGLYQAFSTKQMMSLLFLFRLELS